MQKKCLSGSRPNTEVYNRFSKRMIPRSTKMKWIKILKCLHWMSVIMICAACAQTMTQCTNRILFPAVISIVIWFSDLKFSLLSLLHFIPYLIILLIKIKCQKSFLSYYSLNITSCNSPNFLGLKSYSHRGSSIVLRNPWVLRAGESKLFFKLRLAYGILQDIHFVGIHTGLFGCIGIRCMYVTGFMKMFPLYATWNHRHLGAPIYLNNGLLVKKELFD